MSTQQALTVNDLINYVNSWRETNGIQGDGLLNDIQLKQLVTDIQSEINLMSFDPPVEGGTLVTYNGSIGGVQQWQIAKNLSLSTNQQFYYISDLEPGKILNGDILSNPLMNAVGYNLNGDGSQDIDTTEGIVNKIMNGTVEDGARTPYSIDGELSMNDYVSGKMAMNASGNVITFTSTAGDTVWATTELPELLNNPNITSINKTPIADLLNLKNTAMNTYGYSEEQALKLLNETISFNYETNIQPDVNVYLNPDNSVAGVDASKITGIQSNPPTDNTVVTTASELVGEKSNAELMEKYPNLNNIANDMGIDSNVFEKTINLTRSIDNLVSSSLPNNFESLYPNMEEFLSNIKAYSEIKAPVFEALGTLGTAFLAYDFLKTASESYQLAQNGDTLGAAKNMTQWFGKTIGGLAGADTFMTAIAPLSLSLAACGGPLGIGAGLALELGAGVLGWMMGSKAVSALIDKIGLEYNMATIRHDPVVFDLSGNGIQTVALKDSNVFFDIDGDGYKEKVGWISPDNGILVRDNNNTGQVNDINQLFGNPSKVGFEDLKSYDSNNNGVIDQSDTAFNSLKIWRDLNQNGIVDTGELQTLTDAGIKNINLNYTNTNEFNNNNIISEISTFTWANGKTGEVADVNLVTNQYESISNSGIAIDLDTIDLPILRGYGNVSDLSTSMTTNSDLKDFVKELANLTDLKTLYNNMDELLAKWAGVNNISDTAMNGSFGAKNLAILEKFMGISFPLNTVPSFNALSLENAYSDLKKLVFSNFAVQAQLSKSFIGAYYSLPQDKIILPTDTTEIVNNLTNLFNADDNRTESPYLAIIASILTQEKSLVVFKF